MSGSSDSLPRPLHLRSDSASYRTGSRTPSQTVRLVPSEPPKLLGQGDDVFGRTPLPTHPSHILSPGRGQSSFGQDVTGALRLGFQPPTKSRQSRRSSGSSASSTHITPQPDNIIESATGSPISNPKPVPKTPKKRLQLHKDNKTFSLVAQDEAQSTDDIPQSPTSPSLSTKSSIDFQLSNRSNAKGESNSIISCIPESSATGSKLPSTPAPPSEPPISADPITNSPWNYQIKGGLRKVPKTPDLKGKLPVTSSASPPDLPRTSDASTQPSHDLSTKLSFQSNDTATTTSENTNYKVYRDISPTSSEADLVPPSSSGSNYRLLGESSPPVSESSVIYRPQSARSETISEEYENSNYELHGTPSPAVSTDALVPISSKYSHESLVVPPLRKAAKQRSNEHLGYYKQRSRETLRTSSFTSITSVLTQQEASRGLASTANLSFLPPALPPKPSAKGLWTDINVSPTRSPMEETPHQWSSQLSTVHSVSDLGSARNSRSWSDDRMSSGFPSTPSRNSRHMLSISSSMALQSEDGELSPLDAPRPAYLRSQRHASTSSAPIIEDQDEYGDGITDMQDLRSRPSRQRLSGYFNSVTSSSGDNDRTSTMRSTTSSRANSLISSSLPAWAKLYYGSGERRYLGVGAPGSSTEGGSLDSRNNSFRSGSPNTDHFPLSIYSPRRRPREVQGGARGSMEITPAHLDSAGNLINDPNEKNKFRTWSMSSIWSPHLRRDRRADNISQWEPPSVNWSTEGGWFGRRNVQIVMFITGFIFPFAWWIAAMLPLPENPKVEMQELDNSTSNIDLETSLQRRFGPVDEARYESARWWRKLNRWMSLVGFLIIAAIIVLVILSVKQIV